MTATLVDTDIEIPDWDGTAGEPPLVIILFRTGRSVFRAGYRCLGHDDEAHCGAWIMACWLDHAEAAAEAHALHVHGDPDAFVRMATPAEVAGLRLPAPARAS